MDKPGQDKFFENCKGGAWDGSPAGGGAITPSAAGADRAAGADGGAATSLLDAINAGKKLRGAQVGKPKANTPANGGAAPSLLDAISAGKKLRKVSGRQPETPSANGSAGGGDGGGSGGGAGGSTGGVNPLLAALGSVKLKRASDRTLKEETTTDVKPTNALGGALKGSQAIHYCPRVTFFHFCLMCLLCVFLGPHRSQFFSKSDQKCPQKEPNMNPKTT